MSLIAWVTAGMALAALIAAACVISFRVYQGRQRERVTRTIGPTSPTRDLAWYHGWEKRREIRRPHEPLRHYQYLAAGKIDRLYDQVVEAGQRPHTSTHQFGNASIAQVSESVGPRTELSTVQKLAVLQSTLTVGKVEDFDSTLPTQGSQHLVRGTMLMKHAVLPVTDDDDEATQAVWLGRLDSGRFVCLGGSAANIDSNVPRGKHLNSGVSALLIAISRASAKLDVGFQTDVELQTAQSPEPTHAFPGAWDGEVVDVWLHFNQLHTHRVTFLAYVMTTSRVDVSHARYDVVVGSPVSVEFA